MNDLDKVPEPAPAEGTPEQPKDRSYVASPDGERGTAATPANVAGGTTGQERGKKTPAKEHDSLIETVKTVAYALLIALVIRTFLFQPFFIPSGSMEATLLVGDYLFVEKFAYGYSRFSFPWGLGPIPHGRIWAGNGPQRGDIVVFKLPSDTSTDYIKRVIGLPGDHIQIIDGQIYLNGKAVPRVRMADYIDKDPLGVPYPVTRYRETMPGGRSYYTLARDPSAKQNNTGVFVVPPGHYFMMGDNRDNSLDSRFWPQGQPFLRDAEGGGVGYVPAENLVGKAEFVFFSEEPPLWKIWTWPWTVRFNRIFTFID